MRQSWNPLAKLALVAGIAILGAQPAFAQNAASERGDLLIGKREVSGMVTRVDTLGGIVVIDGRSYLLSQGIDARSVHSGQAVEVAFEPTGLGALRRATRIVPR